jgi:hypothetical protein
MGQNLTSQSPTDSPRQALPRALQRKKLLESGLKIEAGNEKREGRKEEELRVLMTLRSGILGIIWQESKHRYLTRENTKA